MAKSTEDDEQTIFKSISGIMFFGVPSTGMKIASLTTMARGWANETFIHSLAEGSEFLTEIHDSFCETFKYQESIFYYYETVKSPTAVEVSEGKWEMSGPEIEYVVKESATKGTSADHTTAINTTHSELVKFTSKDSNYNNVEGQTKKFIEQSYKIIVRFLNEKGAPENNKSKLVEGVDPLSIAKALVDEGKHSNALQWYNLALKKTPGKIGKNDTFYDTVYKSAASLRSMKLNGLADSGCRWALNQKAHAIAKSNDEVDRVVKGIKDYYSPKGPLSTEAAISTYREEIAGVEEGLGKSKNGSKQH
ncbi:hypothetical protein GP486_006565 [Trichoglossum hirsutum]|uniref:Uncharacterized protein n=1 Tax=Trichoglossum hirsutum TaxID=265104 RepID=A0A9P8IJ17_9PEZI|nr:hypothetical protein GP486_006565 [Trichoglossum hirsutum]